MQTKTDPATPGITQRLSEKIVALSFEAIPDGVVAAARQLVMDGIAVAVAGARLEHAPRILADYLREQGSKPTSSLFGFEFGLAAAPAALVNGASMHVLDFEPMWKPATHALSPVLAAVLALAEKQGANGRDVVTALVKGIEVQGWIREASNTESKDLRFHPPGVVGPIGSVVACSHLLGFDAGQLAIAIGIVSSRCGGLFSNLGTMTKSTHCGYAASSGLEAALLTARGFTGSSQTFDAARQGYAQAFTPVFDANVLLGFGTKFRILDPGYAIKIFPAKFSTHYGITAALELHPQIGSPDDIQTIDVVAAEVPSSDRPHPTTGLDGKFSVQYTIAAALLDGEVNFQTFTDDRLFAADMQNLLSKIHLRMSPDMSSQYNSDRHTEIVITFRDGRKISARCSNPRGSWGAAPISTIEHAGKVRACLRTFIAEPEIDRFLDLGSRFDRLDGREVKDFIALSGGRSSDADARTATQRKVTA